MKKLSGTAKGDKGQVDLGGTTVSHAFAPGGGTDCQTMLSGLISSAKTSIALAAVLTSFEAILQALPDQVDAGIKVSGVHDGAQMGGIERDWAKSQSPNAELWSKIAPLLVAKKSKPFEANDPHNMMLNKVAVVGGKTLATDSFNFSKNATRSAENLLVVENQDLAGQYETFVAGLVSSYADEQGA